MGSFNAMGHVLVIAGSDDVDAMWDLLDELAVRHTGNEHAACQVHSLGAPLTGLPRYCCHPLGTPDLEVRGDELFDTLRRAAVTVARKMDPDYVWRRD